MQEGKTLCTDCFRWVSSLGQDARANDLEAWGTRPTAKLQKAKPEKPVLERYGFTPIGDIPLP